MSDTWNLGLQGGFGRGIGELFTGNFGMPRRRWPQREIDLGEDLRPEPAEQIKPVKPAPRPERPPELSP